MRFSEEPNEYPTTYNYYAGFDASSLIYSAIPGVVAYSGGLTLGLLTFGRHFITHTSTYSNAIGDPAVNVQSSSAVTRRKPFGTHPVQLFISPTLRYWESFINYFSTTKTTTNVLIFKRMPLNFKTNYKGYL
jgi:hypothetical protein